MENNANLTEAPGTNWPLEEKPSELLGESNLPLLAWQNYEPPKEFADRALEGDDKALRALNFSTFYKGYSAALSDIKPTDQQIKEAIDQAVLSLGRS